VAAWAERLSSLDIPILGSTDDALELLRADEDNVDAHGHRRGSVERSADDAEDPRPSRRLIKAGGS
jgi:hypothetical protein